jgi:hypothetical protein
VRADSRERSAAGPLKNFDLWIFSFEAREYRLDIFDLEAKMV